MSDSWDDYAGEWNANIDAIYYSEKAYESLIKEVDIENKNILDFGCGTGLLTEKLATLAKCIIAIDTSTKMIAVLESKNLHNVIPIAENLTLELINTNSAFTKHFDVVVASSVFSFLPDYESTLNLLKSQLISGGILIQWDWLSPEDNAQFGLSETTIRKTLGDTGFKQIVITRPFSITNEKGMMPVVMGVAKNA